MPEFASNGKGNLGVTLGAIGTGLGAMNSTGLLGGLFNGGFNGYNSGMYRNGFNGGLGYNNRYNDLGYIDSGYRYNDWIDRREFDKQTEITELETKISLLEAEKDSEKKMIDVFERLTSRISSDEKDFSAQMKEQAVYNAVNNERIHCMKESIDELYGMTKLYIPAVNVSPQPMNLYNSWTAPTNP